MPLIEQDTDTSPDQHPARSEAAIPPLSERVPFGRWTLIFAFGIFLVVGVPTFQFVGIHLDDAYITARYARNIAAGEGFVFNSGERVLGTTSPLLTVMMAIAMVPMPDETAMRLVAAMMFGFASAAFWLFGVCFGRPRAGLVAALVFPLLDWNLRGAGNETPLFTGLILMGLVAVESGRLGAAAVALGLLPLARGEGLMFAPLIAGYAAWKHGWRRATPILAGLALITLPWFVFSRAYFGEWLPRTLEMKRLQVERGMAPVFSPADFLWDAWLRPGSWYSPIAWLGIWGIAGRAGRRLAVWAAIHTAAYALLRVANYPWYHYPLFALTAWLAGCGVEGMSVAVGWAARSTARLVGFGWGDEQSESAERQWSARRGWGGLALALVLALPLLGAMIRRDWAPRLGLLAPSLEMNQRIQWYRGIAQHLKEHATPDSVVEFGDIGIIGFHAWPMRVLDSMSLVHRDIPPERIGDVNWIASHHMPDWLITYTPHGPLFVAAEGDRVIAYEMALSTGPAGHPELPRQTTLYRRLATPPAGWDHGFYLTEDWGGVPVRWSKRTAEIEVPEGIKTFRIKFQVSHPDVESNPVRITFFAGASVLREIEAERAGTFEFTGETAQLGGTRTVRLEVSRTWLSPEARHLGVAVLPVERVE